MSRDEDVMRQIVGWFESDEAANTPYYVNLGRWAGSVVGPFPSQKAADSYIDTINWKGSRPTVVTVEAPQPPKK